MVALITLLRSGVTNIGGHRISVSNTTHCISGTAMHITGKETIAKRINCSEFISLLDGGSAWLRKDPVQEQRTFWMGDTYKQ